MTNNYSYFRAQELALRCFIFSLLLIFFGCKKDDESTAPSSCKMEGYTGTASGIYDGTVTYSYSVKHTKKYDEKGNLTNLDYTYNYTYSDGKTAFSNSSENRQYDKDGFVTRTINAYTGTDRDNTTSFSNTDAVYEYEKGRLVRSVVNSNSNGKTTNYSSSYEYDSKGLLVKYSNTYNNSSAAFEYDGNVIKKITQTDGSGKITIPFIEVNSKGLITKSVLTDDSYVEEYRFEYDGEGNRTREERWINAKAYDAYVTEYDNKEYPYQDYRYKGHPDVPDVRPYYYPTHNIIKTINYTADMTGKWVLHSTALHTISYNNKNLPTEDVARRIDKDGNELSTNKTSYSYKDCK